MKYLSEDGVYRRSGDCHEPLCTRLEIVETFRRNLVSYLGLPPHTLLSTALQVMNTQKKLSTDVEKTFSLVEIKRR